MGNISSMARASTALDSYVAELGNEISYEKSLSSSRFLKTIVARHSFGPLVLKIFIKPDANMSLRVIQRRLKTERDLLSDLANVNTYQTFVETDKAGYLIRTYAGSNLYDRVSTQPYLAEIEKKWITFQLLTCLRDARTRRVPHGDIKSENVLITSDLTVLVTDFSSSFKPTFLPLDDPSDFSFFFDTSARRTCYIAPERFYASDSRLAQEREKDREKERTEPGGGESFGKRDGRVTEEMDVFSAGCVVAEMWADGRTVFNLSELFAYRQGSVDLNEVLQAVDGDVRDMIREMLSLDPRDRPSFDRILTTYRGTIFPEYFYTFLHDYIISLDSAPFKSRASQPGSTIDRMLDEWGSISVHLDEKDGPALLLLSVVTAAIRNCLWPSARLNGLQLFLNLCPHLEDEAKVDRIVPFVVELLSDDSAIVRAEACRTLVSVITSITSITPHNATFLPEYLLPHMRQLTTDPDVLVRTTYARSLVHLADAAVNMLEMSQMDDYDSMLVEIQAVVQDQATTLLVDPSSDVKRAMLASIADLCLFFGRQKASETVLSHIMTYLNDRDWLLRFAFFDAIVAVGAFIGARAIDEYVLPLMLQALADPEESVVAKVISSLTSLASLGLLPRIRIWDVMSAIKGFLYHPNAWVRQGKLFRTAGFIAAVARNLPPSDVWCILYPSIRPMLECDVLEIDESILSSLVPPLPRSSLVAARSAALSNSPPGFWDSKTTPDGIKGFPPEDEKKIIALREIIFKQAHASRARETDSPDLLSRSLSLTDLGVTPQTVFLTPRTVDAKLELRRFRPDLENRRLSQASRVTADDVRKKLSMEPARTDVMSQTDASPSDSAISSTLDLTALTKGKKAAPAVASVNTTAVGSTTLPEPPYSSYEGQDPSVRAFLDLVDLENYREPLLDFGPRVTASQRKRGARPKPATPQFVTMIAHLTQHTAAITAMVTAPDHHFFATAGEDGAVMVWDVARLERSVSTRPRLTYRMDAPISAMCRIEDTHCLAAAAEDGQLHVLRVHAGAKYRGIECIRTYQSDVRIVHVSHLGESTLLIVTAASVVELLDMRSMEVKTRYQHPLELGPISAVTATPSWLIIGTASGVVSLWDLRFGLLIKSWKTVGGAGVTAVQLQEGKRRVVVATERGGAAGTVSVGAGGSGNGGGAGGGVSARQSPNVDNGRQQQGQGSPQMVSDETYGPLVLVYDIESGKLVETFEARTTRPWQQREVMEEGVPDKGEYIATLAGDVRGVAGVGTSVAVAGGVGSPQGVGSPRGKGIAAGVGTSVEAGIARLGIRSPGSGSVELPSSSSTSTTATINSTTTATAGNTASTGPVSVPPPSVRALIVGTQFASLPPVSAGVGVGGGAEGGGTGRATVGVGSGQGSGFLVTAGDDRVIRYWDLARPGDGFVLCGSQREKDVTFKASTSTSPVVFFTLPNTHRSLESAPGRHAATSQRQPLRPHYDAICALGVVETPFSSCVVSADRSGVIKVWRMEAGK